MEDYEELVRRTQSYAAIHEARRRRDVHDMRGVVLRVLAGILSNDARKVRSAIETVMSYGLPADDLLRKAS